MLLRQSAHSNGKRDNVQQLAAKEGQFFGHAAPRFVTSLLLLGLIMEWLLPLAQLEAYTELYRIGPVVTAAAGFLAVGLFVLPLWISLVMNSAVCLSAVLYLYGEQSPSTGAALVRVADAVWQDVLGIGGGDLMFSGETRTLLMFAGLGMMATAVQSLVWLRQWGLGLTALTVVYLVALYSFLGLDVSAGVIRAIIEGLLLSVLVTIPRIERLLGSSEGTGGSDGRTGWFTGWSLQWWGGAVCLAVFAAAVGAGAAWGRAESAGPAPWAVEAVNWSNEHLLPDWSTTGNRGALRAGAGAGEGDEWIATGSVGYGLDDRNLGAAISPDTKVMFHVQSPEPMYLRGDSKDHYDGKGWSQLKHDLQLKTSASFMTGEGQGRADSDLDLDSGAGSGRDSDSGAEPEPESESEAEPEPESESESESGASASEGFRVLRHTITMAFPAQGWPLFTAGVNAAVVAGRDESANDEKEMHYRVDRRTGALFAASDSESLKTYTIETLLPKADAAALRGLEDEDFKFEPLDIRAEYTELPASLPERVGRLADQIAGKGDGSRYGTVKAIESYLRSSYAYTLTETTIPPKGADFVDHFLFQQRKGYCVHFATAMTIMLRTQGIPARYVKGFAVGEGSRSSESPPMQTDAAVETAVWGSGSIMMAKGAIAAVGDEPAAVKGPVSEQGGYTVRASDAHAWVEVYFPGVGWVSFEPTPGFAAPIGEAGAASAAASGRMADAERMLDGAAGNAAAPSSSRAQELAGRAARLPAAAMRAAEAAAREANALAQAVLGAAAARPWAVAALAAGAIAAAWLAAAAWRRRERIAFAYALRRYGSALQAGRRTAARSQLLLLADACWRELYKRCGARASGRTAREYAAALTLPPLLAPLLADFICWEEQVRYSASADWQQPPTVEQIEQFLSAIQQETLIKSKR